MQKESGNCRKGHIKFGGYDYTIENPAGSFRCSIDADGQVTSVASVRDAEGEEMFPGQQVFLVQGRASGNPKDMLKVAAVDTDGNVTTKHVGRRNVTIGQSVPLDEFKQSRQSLFVQENSASAPLDKNGNLSEETDEWGKPLVKASDGTVEFGFIEEGYGLQPAPIRLSLGENKKNPETGKDEGYGLLHILARHGEQIRKAGYNSVEEFVESVAKGYTEIREGVQMGQ